MSIHRTVISKLAELFKARNLVITAEHLEIIDELADEELNVNSALFDFVEQSYYVVVQDKVGKEIIVSLEDQLAKENHTILLIANEITSNGKTVFMGAVQNSQANLEFWRFYQLLINPLTHSMAPEYKILNAEEKLIELPFLKNNSSLIKTLPRFREDIAIKWLGGKVGDIVRIKRDSIVIGKMTDYKVVKKISIL